MTIRYDVERIVNREVVGKTANNKNNCCNTDNKSKSTLSKWREQAQKSTRTFLESQFGKSLEQFDRGDWRLTKLRCLKFLPKDKQKVINSKGSGRTPTNFYTQLSAKPASTTKTTKVNKVLTDKEATQLLKSIFKRNLDELSYAQKRRIVDTPDIIGILSPEFVKKHNLFPGVYQSKNPKETPGRKPSIVDFVKKLPNEVSLDRLNKVLMSLPLKIHKPVIDEDTGKVTLPKVVWDKFIARRNELPEAMKMHYARELKFIKNKPGRKPKRKDLNNKTMQDIEIEQENLERKNKKNITVVRKQQKDTSEDLDAVRVSKPDKTKPPTKPNKVAKPVTKKPHKDILDEESDDDIDLSDVTDDDLNDLLGRRPSKNKPMLTPKVDKTLDEAKFLPTDQDVIKFINMQMNKALLPDEFPRSSNTPTSQWSTSEWALVDVYRDRINQKFLDNNKERINNALRRLGKTVDANFQKIAKTDKRMALSLIRFNRMFSMGENHA